MKRHSFHEILREEMKTPNESLTIWSRTADGADDHDSLPPTAQGTIDVSGNPLIRLDA